MSDERLRKAFSDAVKGQIKDDIEFLDRKTDEMNRVSEQKFKSFESQLACLQAHVDFLFSKIGDSETFPESPSPAEAPGTLESPIEETSKPGSSKSSRTIIIDKKTTPSLGQQECKTCASTKDQQVVCDRCNNNFCEGCVQEVVIRDIFSRMHLCSDCKGCLSKSICRWIKNPKAKEIDNIFRCQSCERGVSGEALGFRCSSKDHFASFCNSCCKIPHVISKINICRMKSR